jgi:beta-xylosidase
MYSKNPVITNIFTADPSAHVWEDGKIYIYSSHDMDPPRGCDLMDHYHVFSSENMVNWVDEGEILSSEEVTWGRPEGGFMWAPDCAYKNGTYYFYYPHPTGEWNDTWKVGVATSKKPASDFVDQGYIEGLGGFAMIDPCVFVDEDGRNYLYYGGGTVCQGGELKEDMVSLKSGMMNMEGLEDFHEATWVFKRNGIYYLTYADNNQGANRMKYAISDQPLGPWIYQGIFLEPTGCDTTNGSVVEYKGQWYVFYHDQSISNQGNLRTVCIDYLYFNENGTIKPVEQTRQGVKAVGELKKDETIFERYDASEANLGGGSVLDITKEREERSVIKQLMKEGSYCQFTRVNGGKGGRATLKIYYTTKEKLAKLSIKVNAKEYSLINLIGDSGEGMDDGITYLTVRLEQGRTNTITLIGGHGDIAVSGISIELFGEARA